MARPREFDKEIALGKVVELFWSKGFDGTSLDDVTAATGLQKGSIYACFGNKEQLFSLALEQYTAKGPFHFASPEQRPLEKLSLFYSRLIAAALAPKSGRKGCFLFNSCLEFAGKKDSIAKFVSQRTERNERFFRQVMKELKDLGDLPKGLSVEKASARAQAAAFTIQEMSKFKPDEEFLVDVANTFFDSIGAKERLPLKEEFGS